VALQLCDIWFDDNTSASGDPFFIGTATVNVRFRKQDQAGKGHFPRIGRAHNPSWDVVARLRAYIRKFSLRSGTCTRHRSCRDACRKCKPLFPKTESHDGRIRATHAALDTSWFSAVVSAQARSLGLDPAKFSGKSARQGGISSALDAGVPEAVLYLQYGHGSPEVGRTYMRISRLRLLYALWASFHL
jgi:hypothetical protein